MRTVGWDILVLSFALLASECAQGAAECPAPPEYPHTKLRGRYSGRQRFDIGDKVYYSCAEDFTPARGIPVVQCNDDGTWTKLTLKCDKQSCGNAGDLRNGHFEYEGISLGDKVLAVCNEGYTVKGHNVMICKKSGWTGEVPTCEEGEATCSPPAVANSVSSDGAAVSAHPVGDKVTFTCSHGFQLDGAQQITCGPGGQWQPQPPQCLPSPVQTRLPDRATPLPDRATPLPDRATRLPVRETLLPDRATRLPERATQLPHKETGGCGVPKSNSNTNLADKYITKTSFASGERVYYMCDPGYITAGGSRYRTCKEGKWTPLWLRCERKPCGSAGEITNGQFTYSGVEYGDTAEAVCDEGYRLVGRATRRCLSEGWDGRVPTCEPVTCEEPPEVPNAEMSGLQEPPYTYASAIMYQCRVGALHGAREIWCTEDGTWSAPPPTCQEITCPAPNVPGGFWPGVQARLYQYRDTISIECDQGLMRAGPRVITCGRDGRWSPGLPTCRPVRIPRRSAYWRK